MSKKRKHASQTQRDGTDNDKPQYAADYPERKAAKQPNKQSSNQISQEHVPPVKEQLNTEVVGKLNQLRAKLSAEAEQAQSANAHAKGIAIKGASSNHVGGKPRQTARPEPSEQDKQEKSFAELFDPVEEDDASFADLLKDSKLDWRKYK